MCVKWSRKATSYTNKIVGTALTDRGNAYVGDCKM
jgi:hypothetical protein